MIFPENKYSQPSLLHNRDEQSIILENSPLKQKTSEVFQATSESFEKEVTKWDFKSSRFVYGNNDKKVNIFNISNKIFYLSNLCVDYQSSFVLEEAKERMRLAAYSCLASMSYREPDLFADQAGMLTFPFPTEDGGVGYYALKQTIDFGGGCRAFGFCDVEGKNPPLLLFHGTPGLEACGAVGTWIADLDPFGFGKTHYHLNEEAIRKWLKEATTESGQKAIVVGQSLGGAFATQAGVNLNKYIQQVIAFHTPTVDKSTYDQYQRLKEEKPEICSYHNKGDPVSEYGHGFRVGRHFQIDTEKSFKEWIHAIYLFMDDPDCTCTEIQDISAKNEAASSCKASGMRFLGGFWKSLVVLLLIGILAIKKLLIGCQSWGWMKNGLLGVLVLFLLWKVCNPIYWFYALYTIFKSSHEEKSLSLESQSKIATFIKDEETEYKAKSLNIKFKEQFPTLKKYVMSQAWKAFQNKGLSLQEFSAIYFLQSLEEISDWTKRKDWMEKEYAERDILDLKFHIMANVLMQSAFIKGSKNIKFGKEEFNKKIQELRDAVVEVFKSLGIDDEKSTIGKINEIFPILEEENQCDLHEQVLISLGKLEEVKKYIQKHENRCNQQDSFLSLAIPLQIKLIRQVFDKSLEKNVELQKAVRRFFEYKKYGLYKRYYHYLYNSESLIKDVEKFLVEEKLADRKTIKNEMIQCKEYVKKIQKFEAFQGKNYWEEKSKFQTTILRMAAELKKEKPLKALL